MKPQLQHIEKSSDENIEELFFPQKNICRYASGSRNSNADRILYHASDV